MIRTGIVLCGWLIFVSGVLQMLACQNIPALESAYDHCFVSQNDGWTEDSSWPANRTSLLTLVPNEFPVLTAAELLESSLNEVWFSHTTGETAICRYEDNKDSCMSESSYVVFSAGPTGWQAGEVMEKFCVWERRRQSDS